MSELTGQRILLVEDEALVAMATQIMLEEMGLSVSGPAASIETALSLIENDRLDGAVLDINLRGVESYPIADTLKVKGIPFIFVTGYEKPRQHQGVPVVNKPINEDYLEQMLADMLAA